MKKKNTKLHETAIQTDQCKVSSLENKVTKLEDQLDDTDQCEKRDAKIIGLKLPLRKPLKTTCRSL